MLVNLPNGKTVDMSFEDYLHVNMDDYRYLMSQNYGSEMEDPFFGSVLYYLRRGGGRSEEEVEVDEDEDEEVEVDEMTNDSENEDRGVENFCIEE